MTQLVWQTSYWRWTLVLSFLLRINFVHQTRKKKLYIQREKLVLQVAFPQTDIYNYGTREFTLKCLVRKWALMCTGKAREWCSSVTNFYLQMWGAPGDLMVKNPVANAGDTGLIPGSEDPLERKMATNSSILGLKIPWT